MPAYLVPAPTCHFSECSITFDDLLRNLDKATSLYTPFVVRNSEDFLLKVS